MPALVGIIKTEKEKEVMPMYQSEEPMQQVQGR